MRGLRQIGVNLQRQHALRAVAEQRGHEAGAGADFQHLLVLGHGQVLQQARFDARLQHHLAGGDGGFAVLQRNLQVRKGQRAVLRRHEVFAPHGGQQVEHVGVEHVPGTNLLLDHVEAGLFDVHVKSLKSWGGQTLNFRRQTCATGA